MRIVLYLITLSLIMLLGLSVHARSSAGVIVPLGELDRLVAISMHADEDTPVLIQPSESEERSCYCACQPAYSGDDSFAWACTKPQCPKQNKKCDENLEDS